MPSDPLISITQLPVSLRHRYIKKGNKEKEEYKHTYTQKVYVYTRYTAAHCVQKPKLDDQLKQ